MGCDRTVVQAGRAATVYTHIRAWRGISADPADRSDRILCARGLDASGNHHSRAPLVTVPAWLPTPSVRDDRYRDSGTIGG